MAFIELDNLSFQNKKSVVYYSSPDTLISSEYDKNALEIETAGGIKRITVKKTSDGRCCKTKHGIFLTFGGEEGLLIGDEIRTIALNKKLIVTNVHSFDDKVIFGSMLGNLFHFVFYNLVTEEKSQTSSMQAATLSHKVSPSNVYALYGNSQIVSCDHDGKVVWKKFEPNYVVPGLALYERYLVYSSNNKIKLTDGTTTTIMNIPEIVINKIEGMIGNVLYGVCNSKQNIFAFDMKKQELLYEVSGEKGQLIKQLCLTSGVYKGDDKEYNVLFYSTENRLGMVDLDSGTIKFYIQIPKIKSISANEELIILTHSGESHLLRTRKNEPAVVEL